MTQSFGWRPGLLALAVVAVWGINFAVIKLALGQLPPLLFATLRFTVVVLPLVFIVRRPPVAWSLLARYGLLIGVGQFGVLFIAMDGLIAPGLASLVVQVQAFFTISMVMYGSGERPVPVQYLALLLAAGGIAVIMAHTGGATTVAGVGLCLVAAFSWALANIVQRRAGKVDMLGFIVWSSLFAVPPLLVLSLVVEGPARIAAALAAAGPGAWGAVLYQAVGNTIFGYGAWGWLLARYPAASVAPMSLLAPVFGIAATVALLGEPFYAWEAGAAALILGGLAVNLFGPPLLRRWQAAPEG